MKYRVIRFKDIIVNVSTRSTFCLSEHSFTGKSHKHVHYRISFWQDLSDKAPLEATKKQHSIAHVLLLHHTKKIKLLTACIPSVSSRICSQPIHGRDYHIQFLPGRTWHEKAIHC